MSEPTPRETEIWRLIALGWSSRSIASSLLITPKTVDMHRYNLMAKVRAHNVADLTRAAIARGVIPVPTVEVEDRLVPARQKHWLGRLSLTSAVTCATVTA